MFQAGSKSMSQAGSKRNKKKDMMEQEHSFKGEDVVRFLNFLKHLMRQVEGKLLIVWDGSPIHRAGVVKEFLKNGAEVFARVVD